MWSKYDIYAKALEIMDGASPDVRTAKLLLEQAAQAGDHRAVYALATWYQFGKDSVVAVDKKKAAKLFKVVAKAGLPEAQFDYAVSLETGAGVAKNESLALTFYLRAALNGDIQANQEVGRMYYYGLGVAKDRSVAAAWLEHYDALKAGKQKPAALR